MIGIIAAIRMSTPDVTYSINKYVILSFFVHNFLCDIISGRVTVLETLYALSSNTKLVKEIVAKG